jgi:hypothetical protein
MAHPPARAQWLVAMLVPDARREGIVGDLVEEYHEAQVPAHGVAAADRWFMRQALGFLWSAAAIPGLLVGIVLTTRTLIDTTAPVADTANRAWFTTLAVMLIFLFTGFGLGLSRRRLGGVILTAVAATVVGTVVAYAATLAAMAAAQALMSPGPSAWAALSRRPRRACAGDRCDWDGAGWCRRAVRACLPRVARRSPVLSGCPKGQANA